MPEEPSVIARVSTGLTDPILVPVCGLIVAVSFVVSRHVREQWHERVFPHCTEHRASIRLVELLESGDQVRTRTSPYRWVRSSRDNSLYLTIGKSIIFPAEPLRGAEQTNVLTTCMTDPTAGTLLSAYPSGNSTKRSRRTRRRERDRKLTRDGRSKLCRCPNRSTVG